MFDFISLDNLPEIIVTVLGILFGLWGGAKVIFKKIWKAIDEIEDVISTLVSVSKEAADVPKKFLELAEIKEDGTVVFKPEKWSEVKKEAQEVSGVIENLKKEIKEAFEAIKAIFKKSG